MDTDNWKSSQNDTTPRDNTVLDYNSCFAIPCVFKSGGNSSGGRVVTSDEGVSIASSETSLLAEVEKLKSDFNNLHSYVEKLEIYFEALLPTFRTLITTITLPNAPVVSSGTADSAYTTAKKTLELTKGAIPTKNNSNFDGVLQ